MNIADKSAIIDYIIVLFTNKKKTIHMIEIEDMSIDDMITQCFVERAGDFY